MGILTSLARMVTRSARHGRRAQGPHFGRRHRQASVQRLGLNIEPLEERRLLAADIQIGAVYYEEASGEDLEADVIEITFDGGAAGTQLTRLEFDTDKLGDGLTIGDVFFDTATSGLGAFGASPLQIVSSDGIDSVNVSVVDGGTTLVFEFSGFDAGDRLIFSVDVDEQGFLGPNAVAEGNEFEGTRLTGYFSAPHFYDTDGSDIFFDAYDGKLAASGLDLPHDNYTPPGVTPQPVRTAGAMFPLTQTPLPASLSGTVFADANLNNHQDVGDQGIAGVSLELLVLSGSSYVTTGQTTTTNAAGDYRFDNLLPGEYRVVETQPSGYFSVGASAGTVDGVSVGTVVTVDIISDVVLLGGQDSINNDFAESLPAELSGYVYHDVNNDGVMTSDEPGIANVEVRVERVDGDASPITVHTDANGYWEVTGLFPGEYRVTEVQPKGYLDGLDVAGSAGGVAHNPGDQITGIVLAGGQAGINYKFGELLPSSISGLVHADTDGDCVLDPDELPLAGVTIYLLDASGTRIDETTTDANGEYEFTGLAPGVYGIEEVQPTDYFDGDEHVGSAGGTLAGDDHIAAIKLTSGTAAVHYDFCELPPVSISGFVYEDDSNDGVFDTGEAPIAGVTLMLLDAGGNPLAATTTTDTNGYYSFDGLAPGVYGVREVQPDGYFDGLDTAGTAGGAAQNPGDEITGALLDPGVSATQYNFGELRAASLSGRVIADRDDDCELDEDESPIAGVEIQLRNADGDVIRTTHTGADGTYQFTNLRPGSYSVFEVQPSAYFNGDQVIGSAGGSVGAIDLTVGITLDPGEAAVDYNFCEIEPASLSGHVYADLDDDGVRDGGEPGISGVV
ncbi:MAG: carboxypeptidase regulatory-like domain-containing protein, partial [Planctomycetales bacterium]|nr:carboxypeptidase regulatory-like domain-containing protein [Planctomycetales bacterium]